MDGVGVVGIKRSEVREVAAMCVLQIVMDGVGVVGIERSELREVAVMCVLQYPQSYSTVHVMVAAARARGAGGGRPRGFAHGRQERRDFLLISCLILD